MNNFNIKKARREDVLPIIKLLANDLLGKQRESYEEPLPGLRLQNSRCDAKSTSNICSY